MTDGLKKMKVKYKFNTQCRVKYKTYSKGG